MSIAHPSNLALNAPVSEPQWPDLIRQRVNSLRYGSVEITVEDSQIVQIELSVGSRVGRREIAPKFRFKPSR
jgi:hypothetical protein